MDGGNVQERLDLRRDAAAVIVRAYGNDAVVAQVQRLLDMHIGRIVVATNSSAENDKGQTLRLLEEHFCDHPRLQVVDVGESYTWTSALNASIAALRWSGREFQFILPISVEAQFSAEDIDALLTAALEPGVAVVGTTFRGVTPDGGEIELGSSYSQPRNTGLVLNWERLGETVWFDSVCDDLGGMEDFEFMVRLRGLGDKRVVMLDLQVPLSVGIHYNQEEKERRERAAISKISQHYRKLAPEGSPARERIDSVLAELAEKWGLTEEDLNMPLIGSMEANDGAQLPAAGVSDQSLQL